MPDFPHAGHDKNGFYISVNLLNASSLAFVEAAIYAIPKSKLITGAPFIYCRFDLPFDFAVQPSVPTPGEPYVAGANGTEFLLEATKLSAYQTTFASSHSPTLTIS